MQSSIHDLTLALGIVTTTTTTITAPAQVVLCTLVGYPQATGIDKARNDGVIRIRPSARGVILVRSGLADGCVSQCLGGSFQLPPAHVQVSSRCLRPTRSIHG